MSETGAPVRIQREHPPVVPRDEAEGPLEEGRVYLVPCVKTSVWGNEEWWAVLGPCHEDADIIGFGDHHYHLDGRFLTNRQRRRFAFEKDQSPERMASKGNELTRTIIGTAVGSMRGKDPRFALSLPLKILPRTCWRAALPWPFHDAGKFNKKDAWPRLLKEAFAGTRCGRDREGRLVCPHKGAPLTSVAVEGGRITCPLHGLIIDAASGVVLPPESAS